MGKDKLSEWLLVIAIALLIVLVAAYVCHRKQKEQNKWKKWEATKVSQVYLLGDWFVPKEQHESTELVE